ncbi:MAG: glycosyltransferase family 39 protein [Bacteroidota bacterium]|nr:glycosyltransferase family 39 protein [Bacteroidota bacterium]
MVFLKGEQAVYILIVLALALRIHNFSATSIWSDEGVTLNLIHKSFFTIIKESFSDVNAPLYVLATHVWSLIFGYSLSAVRFFSVVCSVLTVLVVFKGADRNFGRSAAFIAGTLVCLSNIHIYYSEEARCYALLCLFAALSLFYFLELLKEANTKNIVLYGLFSLLGLYTQLFFGFQILIQGLIFVFYYRKNIPVIKKIILGYIAVGVLFGIWFVPTFIYKSNISVGDSWIPPLSSKNVTWYFRDVFNTEALMYLHTVLFAIALVVSLVNIKRPAESSSMFLRLLLLASVPFILICLVSYYFIPIFYPRYAMFTSIPLFVLIGLGISKVTRMKYFKLTFIPILIIMVYNTKITGFRNQEWDNACKMEAVFMKKNTCVVLTTPCYYEYCYIYYNLSWAYTFEYDNLWFYMMEHNLVILDDPSQFIGRNLMRLTALYCMIPVLIMTIG